MGAFYIGCHIEHTIRRPSGMRIVNRLASGLLQAAKTPWATVTPAADGI